MDKEKQQYVVGVDIGGTHIRIGAITTEKKLCFFTKKKINDVLDHNQPITSLIKFLEEYIQTHFSIEDTLAIGIGFPSIVSKDKKSIYSTPNLECLSNINIVDPLQDYLEVPVFIDNDVNQLLQFEISKRDILKDDIVLGFYIGTGFGNSIYINQQFLDGKNGAAGELGHIPVLNSDDMCSCGNPSCIETKASGKKLVSIHKESFSDVPFEKIFSYYSNHQIIDEFIKAISIPIVTEINIFDPHLVIIGGGVTGMDNFPVKRLEEYILTYCRKPFPAEGLRIEYAEDTDSAGVIGAATSILNRSNFEDKITS
ncbi:allose kinase [Litchfieldia alkalitelluris]|uniref:allose kinase n=1 Tax=Litchfieldia alkalitelluris TaxID=304268 RepID=UPI000997ACD6|nr:allose kinase [Litchfieldia alkalitelluris]